MHAGAFNAMHVHVNDVRVHAPSIWLHEDNLDKQHKLDLVKNSGCMEHGEDASFESLGSNLALCTAARRAIRR